MVFFLFYYYRYLAENLREKQLRLIRRQFQETIQLLSGNLKTGHSAENAMLEASRQLAQIEGNNAYMVAVLQKMLTKIDMGVPAEAAWMEFAGQCELEEIKEFAKAFALAKRSGASMPFILQRIGGQLVMKLQTEAQIDTMLAGKRFEQKIMDLMPSGILAYMTWTSPDLLCVMYETEKGRLIMTVFLAVYIGACIFSQRITRIPV